MLSLISRAIWVDNELVRQARFEMLNKDTKRKVAGVESRCVTCRAAEPTGISEEMASGK